jgi:ATP-binding cassette subfamily B protein
MFILVPLAVSPTIHPALFLTPFLFVLTYVVVQYFYISSLHKVAQQVRASFGHMNARLAETLDGVEVVKGTAQEAQEITAFNGLVDTVRNWFVTRGDIEARYFAIFLLGIATVSGFLHTVYLYRIDAIEIGAIVSYMGQISLFGFPVFTSIFSFSAVASGLASAQRILSIITTETDLDQNEAGHEGHIEGAITFDNVNFGYLSDKQVLHEMSFTIKPSQTVAVVGQTGSGKSTLSKLINRTYDVNNGQVLVDGTAVKDWNLAALRSQISIIEQ